MNSVIRVTSWLVLLVLLVSLLAYGLGYYLCVHREYVSIASGVDFLYVDETTYRFFRPAIWVYEQSTRRQVALNPMVDPIGPE